MMYSIRRLLFVLFFSVSFFILKSRAQIKNSNKPYKILSSGKQITIKSTKKIQHMMLWTTSGHRVVEQRGINAGSYTFTIPINEKVFFLMVGMEGGKIYSEKIGIQ